MSETAATEKLRHALDALYAATPQEHGVQPRGFGSEQLEKLLLVTRSELPTNDIRKLLSHHHLSTESVRHFLPRAFELLALGGDERLEAMTISSRMRRIFEEIPAEEQSLIRQVHRAAWAYRANSGDGDLTELLDFLGWLIKDVTPYLQVLEETKGLDRCRSLARVLQWQANELADPHDAACHLPPSETEKLTNWLDKVGARAVEEAYFESEDQVCGDIMAEAVSSWSHVRGK